MAIRIVTDGKTITTCTGFETTARLSAGGSWSFTMPAASSESGYLAVLNTVEVYWDATLVAGGYIKEIDFSGEVLSVRGDDMAFELAATTISASATGLTAIADVLTWIGTLLPAGWTLDNQVAGTPSVFLTEISRETLLATLGAVCTAAGLWFVISGKTLTVADAYGSVVNGVQVLSLSKKIDSNDIINRVYPYGNGGKDAAINLQPSSVTVAGYTINKSLNSIAYTGSGYPTREREIQFEKIAPRATTSPALVDAANALVYESVSYLKRYATPVESYSVECIYGGTIRPLQRVALNAKTDSLLVNETPVVTEASTRITAQGVVTTALTLEKDARRIPTDAQVVASAIVQGHKSAIYPAPIAVNPAPSGTMHVTSTGQEFAIAWSVGDKAIQIRSASLTGSYANTGVISGMSPTGLEYRLNGAGSWTTLSGTVDLTSALANATTFFPTATSGVVNMRIAGVAEYVRNVGDTIGTPTGYALIPNGTSILIRQSVTWYQNSNQTGSTGTITAGTIVPSAGNHFYDSTNNRYMHAVTVSGNTRWIKLYDLSSTTITARLDASTSAFDADASATLSIRAVTI